MGAWEIILIIACAAIVLGVAISFIVKKAKGKPTCDCGCDCAHCKGCAYCESFKQNNDQKIGGKTESVK